jgi:dUTP pyrophosphatase
MEINKILYLFVDKTLWNKPLSFDEGFKEFLEKTEKNVFNHNKRITDSHPDSGFDLLCPTGLELNAGSISNKVHLGVRCAMYQRQSGSDVKIPLGFYLYPRSSTGSKTSLRLSNSVGIIDSGYRGELIGVFDASKNETIIGGETRLLQVCSGDLTPFEVKVVYSVDDLNVTTRGSGGFGSTGHGVRSADNSQEQLNIGYHD